MQNQPGSAPNLFDIAHAVYKHITALPSPIRHLYLQPLNINSPRRTSWFLVPSQQRPFYRFSKIIFHQMPASGHGIYAGFSFERGLGRQLDGLVDSTLLMQSDWYWRRFLNDVMAGAFTKPILSIAKNIKSKLKLIIELHNFNGLYARILETREPDDVLIYNLYNGLEEMDTEKSGTQQLKRLNDMKRCYDLVLSIEMDPDFAWYWMRFSVGAALTSDYFSGYDYSPAKLWDEVLSPWMPLIS